MKAIQFTAIISVLALFILSFAKPKKPIQDLKSMKKALKIGYEYVPTGQIRYEGDTITVQGFFMYRNEISNFDYLEYLAALKLAGKTEEYIVALPDTLGWRTPLAFGEKYVDYYLRHPAYRDYPVVNITKAQAEKYCEWLTQVWRIKTGNETIVFRLPKREEFLKATYGNSMERTYSWNSPYILNEKGKAQCNFLTIGSGSIARDTITGELVVNRSLGEEYGVTGSSSDFADITAPANSYLPNEFGLYHLNGNVSEMVAEDGIAVGGDWYSPGYDIRNLSTKAFTKPNPTVGFRVVMTFVETN